MEFMVSFIYGLIQGITEFVPVSSSGHLAILPHLLHMEDPGVIFDLSMHVGTALAVIVYFIVRITIKKKATMIENSRAGINILFTVPLIFAAELLRFAHGANVVANASGPWAAINDAVMTGGI